MTTDPGDLVLDPTCGSGTSAYVAEQWGRRWISTSDETMDDSASEREAQKQQDFAAMILNNLRAAGVQTRNKDERLKFETLDPFAGSWLNAVGSYTDAAGKSHSVAVSIGPEHGTVGPEQVKEAAKEAVRGLGFDTLVVCGYSFDPHVNDEARSLGNLQVLIARMNPDLSMGGDLLKKTGTGNLFMVFGEPDIDLTHEGDNLRVTIKGVDVYDPTTGEVRTNSTDDIACWFIDTDYNGESFFVRHAYFTGKDQPYEKLKRALRADIDEAAWASLYRTTSRPFPCPRATSTNKEPRIAVKVINHYGDEVLKVFPIK
jgi:adenine-specific DNA-methyltransferase